MEKRTVLIVEDEKNIVDILRFNLQREGYNTLEAYDGETGLNLALSEKPDLTVISFGLNDCVVRGRDYADTYADNLRQMFNRLKEEGSEVIYMTPPMMCRTVCPEIEGEFLRGVAKNVADAPPLRSSSITLRVESRTGPSS